MNVLGSVFLGDAQRQRVLSQSTPPSSPQNRGHPAEARPPPAPIDPKLSLELRIRWLEVLLLGVKHDNRDTDVSGQSGSKEKRSSKPENETLVRKAEEVQKRLEGIVDANDGLRKFIDRFDQHAAILNPSFALSGSTVAPSYSSMTAEELDASLVEMESEIRAADRDLREIDLLEKRGVLGAGKLEDYNSLKPRLETLQKAHAEDLSAASDIERRVANVLKRYASRVDALSELFVEWNDALSAAEDKIVKLERESNEKSRLGLE